MHGSSGRTPRPPAAPFGDPLSSGADQYGDRRVTADAPFGHPFRSDRDDDRFHEECGVFGVFGHREAATLTALGLHALQHRGQEGAGIVSFNSETNQFSSERRLGLVGDYFNQKTVIERLSGRAAIGHNRYSTSGEVTLRNVQPLFAETASGGIAVAHNGNLTNAVALRRELVARGAIFQATSDTEVILHLVATSRFKETSDCVADALRHVEGAYSLVTLTRDKLIGIRDPMGVRPLIMGALDGATILASESCALDIIGARFVRDVEPGEMVIIDGSGVRSLHPFMPRPKRFCIFEYVYFARPDSLVEGHSVYEARKRIGRELAREAPADVDLVIPVPDSGVPAALGFAEGLGVPFDLGIIRNHYVGRTFIEPTDQIRHFGVKLKHNANRAVLGGKRIALVDDSIVRGTTSLKIVAMVREAGAAEVHMRIASPPTIKSCHYGVDTPEDAELMAARANLEEMRRRIGVDSLAFVSIDGLYRAMGEPGRSAESPQFCDACFTGDYPIPLVDRDEGHADRQLSLLTEGL
ncbi:MAG: amidophosphoribosyltransferase [Alphaproteobacteria bacterium]|nr:amidophosphoribosyltransferase [Alphaproteobacteria bacterium]